MNNSFSGKTTENITKNKDIYLFKSREKYGKYLMKPNFNDSYPFSKMLFAVEYEKTTIKIAAFYLSCYDWSNNFDV